MALFNILVLYSTFIHKQVVAKHKNNTTKQKELKETAKATSGNITK